MKRFPFVVEAVAFFGCAAFYTSHTIENQFIYQVVSESHSFTSNHSVEYCDENQTRSMEDQIVADETSKWIMYSKVATFGPNAISGLVLTSLSEKIGRKRALFFPAFGCLLSTTVQAFIILFRLPLFVVALNGLIRGGFGYYFALMDISTAYLSDTVRKKDRSQRYTILEVSSSIGGGLVMIGTGYWIKYQGFVPSSFLLVGCAIACLVLVFFLPNSKPNVIKLETGFTVDDIETEKLATVSEDVADLGEDEKRCRGKFKVSKQSAVVVQIREVLRIYTSNESRCHICSPHEISQCSHGGGNREGRVWRLWFYVIAWTFYLFVINGIFVFQTMYFVSYPICFTPELVGVQNGIDVGAVLLSPFVVKVYESCLHMNSQTILLTAISARILTSILMYLARGSTLVFIATFIGVFSSVTMPFLRVRISYLVSSSEQGSSLALISCISSLVNIFSPIAFLTIYPSTLHISYSFTWLITTSILLLTLGVMIVVWIANKWGKYADMENRPT